jgi:hypothetical protein
MGTESAKATMDPMGTESAQNLRAPTTPIAKEAMTTIMEKMLQQEQNAKLDNKLNKTKQVRQMVTLETPEHSVYIGHNLAKELVKHPVLAREIAVTTNGEVWRLKLECANFGGYRVNWIKTTENFMKDLRLHVWEPVCEKEKGKGDKKEDKGKDDNPDTGKGSDDKPDTDKGKDNDKGKDDKGKDDQGKPDAGKGSDNKPDAGKGSDDKGKDDKGKELTMIAFACDSEEDSEPAKGDSDSEEDSRSEKLPKRPREPDGAPSSRKKPRWLLKSQETSTAARWLLKVHRVL